jgi:hypothetical protein
MIVAWKQEYTHLRSLSYTIATNDANVMCPLCQEAVLRFYYHRWPRIAGFQPSAMWIWCQSCRHWGVAGNILAFDHLNYRDPFAFTPGEEFEQMEMAGWLDRLNSMWDKNDLPHKMDAAIDLETADKLS